MYDIFTITRSVTVEAEPGVLATIDTAGTTSPGITVAAGSTDVVTLRNLTLHSPGGGVGIQITSGGLITVEDCVNQNFFHALDYTANASGHLSVKGGSYEGSDTGIFLCCASGPSYTAAIDGVHIYGGDARGINADGTHIAVTRSFLTGPGPAPASGPGILVAHGTAVIENNSISGYQVGVEVLDKAFLSSNTITGNSVGVVNNATAFSRRNNTIAANRTNVSGTLTPFPGL